MTKWMAPRLGLTGIILALLSFGTTPCARACSVPVFRYALQAWTSANYDLFIFHRGPLNERDKAAVGELIRGNEDPGGGVNLSVEVVDLNQIESMNARVREIWKTQQNPVLPHAVLCLPESPDTAWSGSVSAGIPLMLAKSPARTEIAKRIVAGDSIVFVLLQSGNAALDTSAAELLQKELPALQAVMKLPERDPEDDAPEVHRKTLNLPLRLKFSSLQLSRSDAAESHFIKLLMSSEKNLPAELPIVFPVFGRGRVLCGLSGRNLSAPYLGEAAMFLTGACSCQVKELNPGTDLLMAVNWDDLLEQAVVEAEKNSSTTPAAAVAQTKMPLAQRSEMSPGGPIYKHTSSAPIETPPAQVVSESGSRTILWVATILAAILVVITGRHALKTRTSNLK